MDAPDTICLNCGHALQGKFCSACGQKVIEPSERTVKHFIYQFLGSAFFLENNFFKNLWVLLTKPGQLPLDFIEGRRKQWMPPFSLFLLINLFYFWYVSMSDMNLSLREQMFQPHHGPLVKYLVNKKIKAEGISLEDYAAKYNSKSTTYSNSLVILHVPILAVLLMLYYFRKKYFYVDHFIFALYFMAFLLLLFLFQTGWTYALIAWMKFNSMVVWRISVIIILVVIGVYIFYSVRKTYKQSIRAAAIVVMPVFAALLVAHILYRTLLFLIIFVVT